MSTKTLPATSLEPHILENESSSADAEQDHQVTAASVEQRQRVSDVLQKEIPGSRA
jgi:hypothetical protein